MQFGDRIKRRRAELGFTQHELAKRAEIAGGTMSSYESSRKMPPADVALRLANVLGVTVEWLLSGENRLHIDSYGDFVRTLIQLEDVVALKFRYGKKQGELVKEAGVIVFEDDELARFMSAFEKIRANYRDGLIDRELMELWLEKELRKLDSISMLSRVEAEEMLKGSDEELARLDRLIERQKQIGPLAAAIENEDEY